MRIQEMRSGLAHFKKREDENRSDKVFEMHSILEPDLLPELTAAALAAEARDPSALTNRPVSPAFPSSETAAAPSQAIGEPGTTDPSQSAEPETAAASELDQQIWSVVSFERVEAGSLTYQQAIAWMDELQLQGVNGLCIVTDEAAKRIKT